MIDDIPRTSLELTDIAIEQDMVNLQTTNTKRIINFLGGLLKWVK